MGDNLFTVFVLLYGDFTPLAMRCIESIIKYAEEVCPEYIRVGVNEGCAETYDYLSLLVREGRLLDCNIYWSKQNAHKYPLMRQMFYDSDNPIETEYVMWFDDDSFIRENPASGFMRQLEGSFSRCGHGIERPDMLGGVYTMQITKKQIEWIKAQPWRTPHLEPSNPMRFATGGWWAARMDMLRALDYPWKCLDHRGGDVMLGAAIEQKSYVLRNYRHGVAINADLQGRESKSDRRGFDQPPLGTRGAATEDLPPCEPAVMLCELDGPTKLSRLAAKHAHDRQEARRRPQLRHVLDL